MCQTRPFNIYFQIGKLDLLVIVDSTEQYCRDNMDIGDEEKLTAFRSKTLPVLGHYDDHGAVVVVSIRIDNWERIFFSLLNLYKSLIVTKYLFCFSTFNWLLLSVFWKLWNNHGLICRSTETVLTRRRQCVRTKLYIRSCMDGHTHLRQVFLCPKDQLYRSIVFYH